MSTNPITITSPVRERLARATLTSITAYDYAGGDGNRRKAVPVDHDVPRTIRLTRLAQSWTRTTVAAHLPWWAATVITTCALVTVVVGDINVLLTGALGAGITLLALRRWSRASFIYIDTLRAHHYWDEFTRAQQRALKGPATAPAKADVTRRMHERGLALQVLIEKYEKLTKTSNDLDGYCSPQLRDRIDEVDRAMFEIVVATTVESWPAPHTNDT